MSAALLNRVKDYADAANLLAGYEVKFFRWTDADVAGNTPFVLFRQSGSGGSDMLVQQINVSIILVATPTTALSADARAQQIARLFRVAGSQDGLARFDTQGAVIGPMYMENGRPVFEIVVRCYTEDQ